MATPTEYDRAYKRGWDTSRRGGSLEAADDRGEPSAWYDGYYDHAAGRDKWHTADCPDPNHTTCG